MDGSRKIGQSVIVNLSKETKTPLPIKTKQSKTRKKKRIKIRKISKNQ